MPWFTLGEVLDTVQGTTDKDADRSLVFGGVATDTRKLAAGDLFIALKGERFDGHDFIRQAFCAGAKAAVVSRKDISCSQGVIVTVEDTRRAFQDLARYHRLKFGIPVIGVTGSNGKTTTKDMIAAVLASRFKVLKTEANYNNEIGLPLTLMGLTDQHQAAVVEMGMRALGEIRELSDIALPTAAVITNVGETHIEVLGSVDNIAKAKAELVEAVGKDGWVILNADDPHVRAMSNNTSARVVFYGIRENADVSAQNIRPGTEETVFECCAPAGRFEIHLPVIGVHNVYNALAAIASGLELGLTMQEVQQGLAKFKPTAMRLSVFKSNGVTVINDAYNASPVSMTAAIDTLASVAEGRTVAVLGDMLELGQIAVDAHRKIGARINEKGINVLVTVGELARNIFETAKTGMDIAAAFDNHQDAQEFLRKNIRPGDTVLVKGSRGMRMEKIVEIF